MKKNKIKKQEKKIDLWSYYSLVESAVQRYCLIKKALGIKVDDYNKEMDWVLETFNELSIEGETSCGYLTIETYKDEDGKQKINFYFNLAEN